MLTHSNAEGLTEGLGERERGSEGRREATDGCLCRGRVYRKQKRGRFVPFIPFLEPEREEEDCTVARSPVHLLTTVFCDRNVF